MHELNARHSRSIKTSVLVVALVSLFSCSFSPKTDVQYEPKINCPVAWELPTGITASSRMVCMNGNSLYTIIGSPDDGLPYKTWKVNLDTGIKTWETIEITGMILAIQICGGYVFVFANSGSNMLCFDDSTGTLLATVQFDVDAELAKDKTVWLGKVVSDGSLLVWGAGEGLCSFDISRIDFSKPASAPQILPPVCLYTVPEYTGVAATPVIEDHIVYFMRHAYMDRVGENTIAAYNLLTDSLVWERKSNKMTGLVIDGMIVAGDWLYIIDAYGSTCINKKTGGKDAFTSTGERWVHNEDEQWGINFAANPYGMGLVIYDGCLYFTTSAHSNTWSYLQWPKERVQNILCLNCVDGSMRWGDMPYNCDSLGSRPVVAKGKVYIARYEGLRVYDSDTGRLLGVDTSIPSSQKFSTNQYYENGNLVIVLSKNSDGTNGRIIAIRAE